MINDDDLLNKINSGRHELKQIHNGLVQIMAMDTVTSLVQLEGLVEKGYLTHGQHGQMYVITREGHAHLVELAEAENKRRLG